MSAPLCEGFAKAAAIRSYKAEMGTVQGSEGSEGIEYGAKIMDNVNPDSAIYIVDIFDNNEDGDTWTVNYLVEVKKNAQQKCIASPAKKIGVVVD